MEMWTDRTEMLVGRENLSILKNSRIAIFGVGGVGGAAMEALARSNIGYLRLIDADIIAPSNLNRQLIATTDNIGLNKVDVAEQRLKSINPDLLVDKHKIFVMPDCGDELFDGIDFVLDCIDTVTAKLHIIATCKRLNIPVISSMGAGNRSDPSLLKIADISKTFNCKLAKVMRVQLRKKHIYHLPVVFSSEIAQKPLALASPSETKPNHNADTCIDNICTDNTGLGKKHKVSPASMMFVPAVAGLLMGNYVIQQLLKPEA